MIKTKKLNKTAIKATLSSVMVLALSGLVGCSKPVTYNPDDFVTPNRVVTKNIDRPVLPQVNAAFGIGNDPSVVRAYKLYQKTGKMETVRGQGWVTYPYSDNTKPIIACSTLHFCIIELEAGDSKPDSGTTVLRFYYPQETMINNVLAANKIIDGGGDSSSDQSSVVTQTTLSNGTDVNLSHVNFNYKIKGDTPPWRPLRVFDDAKKTYVEMPAMASAFSLPVLYLQRNNQMQMVNYRYEKPYFVVDGLFGKAWLISGKGSNQVRVEILNKNIQD
ncbi:MAG: TrbG/VirB9 family P-type conjugative transfer protein [Gammaproteobacteria bacterium]|nr:TrbG/VirB9 family P-type conjugative transfer protein [Gammaproteobacteria bacterium]